MQERLIFICYRVKIDDASTPNIVQLWFNWGTLLNGTREH